MEVSYSIVEFQYESSSPFIDGERTTQRRKNFRTHQGNNQKQGGQKYIKLRTITFFLNFISTLYHKQLLCCIGNSLTCIFL